MVFYLIFTLGLTFFATYPTITKGTYLSGLILGGLFGLVTYATYDLTNQATLRDWPVLVTVVDILWGTVLGMSLVSVTTLLYNWFFG